jgi:hypothetical protein
MSTSTGKTHRPIAAIVSTALITFTVTVVGLIETVDWWAGLLHPTRVKISRTDVKPNPHSPNARLLDASGSFQSIGEGQLLWLAIRPPGDSRIYPNAQPCATDEHSKTWSCSILFGTPSPGRPMPFHVIVMRTNAQAVTAIFNYQSAAVTSFPGFPALPAGATKGDEIDVHVQ